MTLWRLFDLVMSTAIWLGLIAAAACLAGGAEHAWSINAFATALWMVPAAVGCLLGAAHWIRQDVRR